MHDGPMMRCRSLSHTPLSSRALLLLGMIAAWIVLPGASVLAGPEGVLQIDTNEQGEIQLRARGATLADTLSAIASKAGFEVVMDAEIQRPPVDMTLSLAPVEEVVRQVLHGRNYSLLYDEGDDSLSRVFVLPPSSASPSRRPIGSSRSRVANRGR